MKIAVLIPDRGDRPDFMKNCLRMINAQTRKPDIIEVVNDAPRSEECDITWRYRIGYDRLRKRDLTLILLMENDDWYHPEYIETMIRNWSQYGYPNIFGTRATIYYHIDLFKWMVMNHHKRSSAMSTVIRADLDFKWCEDAEPYTDIHLWTVIKDSVTYVPEKLLCMGIKHGIGLCGGKSHTTDLNRYINNDADHAYLRKHMDQESFEFYTNYFKRHGSNSICK